MSLVKQSSQNNKINRYVNCCKDIPGGTTLEVLEVKLTQINTLYQEYNANQAELEEQCGQEALHVEFTKRQQFDEYYELCCATISSAIRQIKEAMAKHQEQIEANKRKEQSQQQPQKEVKLPRIELKPFSGRYEDWMEFRDLFHTLIHTNQTLEKVQKLHYLKCNVEGEAKNLLKSLTITKANYDEAWVRLTARYDHKRFIVDNLLKSFINQPKVHSENSMDIKELIDRSSQIMQSHWCFCNTLGCYRCAHNRVEVGYRNSQAVGATTKQR